MRTTLTRYVVIYGMTTTLTRLGQEMSFCALVLFWAVSNPHALHEFIIPTV